MLNETRSVQLFDMLLEPGSPQKRAMIRLAFDSILQRQRHNVTGWHYLNVGHTGLNWPSHLSWINRTGVRPIYFAHDLIPLSHPEYCRQGESEKHFKRVLTMLLNGAGIIANSRDTLIELEAFSKLRRQGPMPPTLVAPLGVDSYSFAINEGGGESALSVLPARPYFIMIGTIEGRKNHLLLLNLWTELAKRLGRACPQLVIIGQRGWESEQAIDMLDRSDALKGHVIELSRCDDDALRAYIRGARALLFPSFAEGYGLPLVEALGEGTPVIASDLAVFRELAGGIPDYFSPLDGLGWMRAIESYAQPGSPERSAQLHRMEGYRPPSWEQHFAVVDRWLDSLN